MRERCRRRPGGTARLRQVGEGDSALPLRRGVLRCALLSAAAGVVSIVPATGAADQGLARAAARPSPAAGPAASLPVVLSAPAAALAYRTWEAVWSEGEGVGNPFDAREAQALCVLRSPTGRTCVVDGFYYQGYERQELLLRGAAADPRADPPP